MGKENVVGHLSMAVFERRVLLASANNEIAKKTDRHLDRKNSHKKSRFRRRGYNRLVSFRCSYSL